MDEYNLNDLQFVSVPLDDERNARGGRQDHRPPGRPATALVPVGARRPRPVGAVTATRPVVIYQQAPEPEPTSTSLLGNLTAGELIELAGQVFAALQPLPGAPVATGDTKLDVENLITYQGALALHAKQDERLRTVASLIGKLITK